MPGNHEPRELGTSLKASGQSPMLSAAAAMPFRPYIWHGDDSPVIGSPAELETRGQEDGE